MARPLAIVGLAVFVAVDVDLVEQLVHGVV